MVTRMISTSLVCCNDRSQSITRSLRLIGMSPLWPICVGLVLGVTSGPVAAGDAPAQAAAGRPKAEPTIQAATTTAATNTPAAAPLDVAAQNPLARNSLEQLAATRDRPLFSPSRRPPPPPIARVEPPPPPPPPPQVALMGVVIDGEGVRALIRPGPMQPFVLVRVGGVVAGWHVTEIEDKRLVLALDDRKATFTLFKEDPGHQKSPIANLAMNKTNQPNAQPQTQTQPPPGGHRKRSPNG